MLQWILTEFYISRSYRYKPSQTQTRPSGREQQVLKKEESSAETVYPTKACGRLWRLPGIYGYRSPGCVQSQPGNFALSASAADTAELVSIR